MNEYIDRWNFVRSETLEILNSLNDDMLLFCPAGDKWQALYYQFACINRTQIVYTRAALTGKMDFTLFSSKELPNKHDHKTKNSLVSLLAKSDADWQKSIQPESMEIDWNGSQKSMQLHVQCLAEHERIHHGQMISYFTLAGFKLPGSFRSNWAL